MGQSSLFALLCCLALLWGCASEPDYCRHDPGCGGGIGGYCDFDEDCQDGYCCRGSEDSNCGPRGLCTYRCDRDADCPAEMLCQHDRCFFACRSDSECALGQECDHRSADRPGVCEWD